MKQILNPAQAMNYLGIDLGTSSIKVSLLDGQSLKQIGSAQSPADEMEMIAHRPGWAEQEPESWWKHLVLACKALKSKNPSAFAQVSAVGISYQMHGLVLTDENLKPLRPSILWCDSRAVAIGDEAFKILGKENCLAHYLNSPGNFTASKLKWVKENEPSIYDQIHHVLLPGDYLAACLTGEVSTTLSGLSEGILWDFMNHKPAHSLLTYYDLAEANLPVVGNSFGAQGNLKSEVAAELGLPSHVSLCYRGGDQLTNALALGVTEPGQVAADAGTSGTIVGLSSKPVSDPLNRINTFAHVNHTLEKPRYAVLACLNGAGSFYSWVRRLIGADTGFLPSYEILNDMSAGIHPGCDHLRAYPFGNGAERMLHNQNPGGSFVGLNFHVHTPGHLLRATQEGIIFG
ncbi:MAG TPA: FGGY family carbohydrate kinase, partial [Catalimonadaceae bacterium]|nr:FGGY family carbohydrate kinase [Catalimonadaceae bacterium]